MTHDQAEAIVAAIDRLVRARIVEERRRQRGLSDSYLDAMEIAELARKQLVTTIVEASKR